jgi:hypothetical protein
VQTPGPGSRGTGPDRDKEIDDERITTPGSTGRTGSGPDDCELPTQRAMLVIVTRRVDEGTGIRHTQR